MAGQDFRNAPTCILCPRPTDASTVTNACVSREEDRVPHRSVLTAAQHAAPGVATARAQSAVYITQHGRPRTQPRAPLCRHRALASPRLVSPARPGALTTPRKHAAITISFAPPPPLTRGGMGSHSRMGSHKIKVERKGRERVAVKISAEQRASLRERRQLSRGRRGWGKGKAPYLVISKPMDRVERARACARPWYGKERTSPQGR